MSTQPTLLVWNGTPLHFYSLFPSFFLFSLSFSFHPLPLSAFLLLFLFPSSFYSFPFRFLISPFSTHFFSLIFPFPFLFTLI